jgi:hypothetical protein
LFRRWHGATWVYISDVSSEGKILYSIDHVFSGLKTRRLKPVVEQMTLQHQSRKLTRSAKLTQAHLSHVSSRESWC